MTDDQHPTAGREPGETPARSHVPTHTVFAGPVYGPLTAAPMPTSVYVMVDTSTDPPTVALYGPTGKRIEHQPAPMPIQDLIVPLKKEARP